MRKAEVKIHGKRAGILFEESKQSYVFQYSDEYHGPPVSLTMPARQEPYLFKSFPPFFDGLLPEGIQLDGMLKKYKIDRADYFRQLMLAGLDLVGAVTIEEINE